MINNTPIYQGLHNLYCSLTMRNVRWDSGVMYRWELWYSRGWREEDLVAVVKFIKGKISAGGRKEESLRLYNLLDLSRFEDDLIDARGARERAKKPRMDPNKGSVLRSTGRPGEVQVKTQTPAQVMADAKAFEDFKEWRKKTGL